MYNEALMPAARNKFNSFTRYLHNLISEKGSQLVKCRNGEILEVFFKPGNKEGSDPCFYAQEWEHCFSANGSSARSSFWDLIMIVE